MLRLRAMAERQTLVEELYDELEIILLGKHGNAEEEDQPDIITFQQESPDEAERPQSKATDQAWRKSLIGLLGELEKTRHALHGGLTKLERLVEKNCL
jgi:hypothetical protein